MILAVVVVAAVCTVGGEEGRDGDGGKERIKGGSANYLSVERGGIGESGWEGRRQLRRVEWV